MLRTIVTSVIAAVTGLSRALVARASGREPARILLGPGDMAPDFELPASDGRAYRLSDSRGRQAVVMAWFPKAFTGGCTVECRLLGASHTILRGFKRPVFRGQRGFAPHQRASSSTRSACRIRFSATRDDADGAWTTAC